MAMSFQHPSYLGRLSRTSKAADEQAATPEAIALYEPQARYSKRACCCPAAPAVIAVIPPGNGRHADTELLLCGHHYRQSRRALIAMGVTLTDVRGYLLTPTNWPESAGQASER
jgi:hypothetical protein